MTDNKGYIVPRVFSQMILSFIEKDFSEFHPEIFADTLMMPTTDNSLRILKHYLSALAWRLEKNGVIGWETEQGRRILQNLAVRLKQEPDYDFILDIISNSLR